MGKGSNVNKKMAAQAANAKDKTATKEERAASKAKAEKDSAAFICKICRQTFMVSATPAKLYTHVTAKHDKEAKTPQNCFQEAPERPTTRSQRTLKSPLTHSPGTVAGWAEGQ